MLTGRMQGLSCLTILMVKVDLGTFDCFKVFLDFLFKLQASNMVIITTILHLKDNQGIPCFWYAMCLGKLDYVEVFMNTVLGSKLNQSDISTFISGKSENYSSINMALYNWFIKCAKLYVSKILNSTLREDADIELLSVKNKMGSTSFLLALTGGFYEFVGFFIGIIAISDKLNSKAKVDILLARNELKFCSSLHLANDANRVSIIRVFMVAILSSTLDEDIKKQLLISEDHTESSIWRYAKNINDGVCFDVYVAIIQKRTLNKADKKELLSNLGESADAESLYELTERDHEAIKI